MRSNVLIRTSLTDHSLESSRFWWRDARLVRGVAFKKTFTYAGAEQQPKSFKSPFILCLNVELELKAEKDNAEVRVEQVSEYQAIVDAEWEIIFRKSRPSKRLAQRLSSASSRSAIWRHSGSRTSSAPRRPKGALEPVGGATRRFCRRFSQGGGDAPCALLFLQLR